MLLLDLFCKAGGAGQGYADAGFTVVGVDIKPQPNYPGQWAEGVGVPVYAVKAEWSRFGDNAGPIRNAALLLARPDFVVAFPGGDGTANMKDLARRAGVAVVELELDI